jgi:hypothetical protein
MFVAIGLLIGCAHTPTIVPPSPAETLADLAEQIDSLPEGTHVKMLFALRATKGKIERVGDARRVLTLDVSDVTSVVGFTDRPQRYAFNMTAPMLAAMWGDGQNSFVSDPPNAVIEDSRARMGVTEVTGFAVSDGVVKVQLDRMAYKSLDAGDSLDGEVKDLTLFIDSSWLKATGASVAFGLQQAAKACVSVDCEFWPLGG